MSLIIGTNGFFLRGQWGSLPTIAGEKDHPDEVAKKLAVPRSMEDLGAWAYVRVYQTPSGNRYHLLYADAAGGTAQVALRVEGFVDECNLSLYGDWDGTAGNAPQAKQMLVLTGGSFPVLFEEQGHVLQNLRELCYRSTGSKKISEAIRDRLHLQNSVFIKASPSDGGGSILTAHDDPTDREKVVRPRWRVAKKIRFGRVASDGQLRACTYMSIQPGDFVDVLLMVHIHTYRTKGGRETSVTFGVDRVVQLCDRRRVAEILYGTGEEPPTGIADSVEIPVDDMDVVTQ